MYCGMGPEGLIYVCVGRGGRGETRKGRIRLHCTSMAIIALNWYSYTRGNPCLCCGFLVPEHVPISHIFLVQMTLVRPAVNGMEPDKPLYKEQEWVPSSTLSLFTWLVVLCVWRGLDFSTTWRDRYEEARRNLILALNITHPVMQAILALWQANTSYILIDFSELRAKGPLDIEWFCSLMTLASERGEEKMMTSWYPKVINIFSGDQSVVGNVSFDKVKMERFNDSVSTLLGNQVNGRASNYNK